MRVLVTGATGFIGSHLVAALIERGDDVVSVSRSLRPSHSGCEHHVLDVEGAIAPGTLGRIDALVHLAGAADASSSLADPVFYGRVNALGTLNVLELARRCDAAFVLASSQRVYRPKCAALGEDVATQPVDPYGYSKLVAEQWVRMYHELYGLRTVVLRFFSVYGPGQLISSGSSGVVSIFAQRALRGEPLSVNSASLRDFTEVSDVVQGILLALEQPGAAGRTYNIATGTGTSIATLAELVREIAASASEIRIEGNDCGASYVADITRAGDELGYEPRIGLRQGLERYVAYLRRAGEDPA